jgi:hypothetical protein
MAEPERYISQKLRELPCIKQFLFIILLTFAQRAGLTYRKSGSHVRVEQCFSENRQEGVLMYVIPSHMTKENLELGETFAELHIA